MCGVFRNPMISRVGPLGTSELEYASIQLTLGCGIEISAASMSKWCSSGWYPKMIWVVIMES